MGLRGALSRLDSHDVRLNGKDLAVPMLPNCRPKKRKVLTSSRAGKNLPWTLKMGFVRKRNSPITVVAWIVVVDLYATLTEDAADGVDGVRDVHLLVLQQEQVVGQCNDCNPRVGAMAPPGSYIEVVGRLITEKHKNYLSCVLIYRKTEIESLVT
ncbi:hypothetical protein QE152_g3844 [Popillia japonica]|uniref:Uncharacterized protein n=1 Tax=Popillia japonica TaxID=7064 RepID=A0AAW1MZ21_POPJA